MNPQIISSYDGGEHNADLRYVWSYEQKVDGLIGVDGIEVKYIVPFVHR